MFRTSVGLLAVSLLALLVSSGCAKSKCEVCTQDSDCMSGLVCHPELKICRTRGDKPSCQRECSESEKCAQYALCTLKNNRCIIGELDCSKSAQCTDEGRCTRKDLGNLGTCVTINPDDCAKSTFCRTKGYCSVDRKSRLCRALSDADCKQAEICKKQKKCKAHKGDCVAAEP